ncbi:MAG: hypothetical protein NUV67_03150 [archaeon]|nr:hypothetical protein [archaeon]
MDFYYSLMRGFMTPLGLHSEVPTRIPEARKAYSRAVKLYNLAKTRGEKEAHLRLRQFAESEMKKSAAKTTKT